MYERYHLHLYKRPRHVSFAARCMCLCRSMRSAGRARMPCDQFPPSPPRPGTGTARSPGADHTAHQPPQMI